MRNKRSAVSKNSQIEGGVNQLTMNCPGTVTENELPTAKSSLLNPLSSNHIQSVLTDITNTPSSSNCMQRDDSCLTYSNTLNVTHIVRPESQSMWFAERLKGLKKILVAQFGICCCEGKIIVPLLKRPPEELEQLFLNKDSSHAKFLRNIRLYNMFSFTSMGGKIDHSINSKGGGPYSFVLSGQNHHLIGSLLPP
ncbi:hypothetical protein K1719_046461 [Acacia pycnantha]|nr:hypothetical protein K1719_046461 [Acacia pycnantha]